MSITWNDYINSLIDTKDIPALKEALRNKQIVYFYGAGLGKTTLCNILLSAGYKALEPGLFKEATGPNYIPDNNCLITFKLKNTKPVGVFRGSKDEIHEWVNQ